MKSTVPISLSHSGPPDVLLWRVDIDFTRSLNAPMFACLSSDERERAARYRRTEDALRFATVRAALRDLLAPHCGGVPGEIVFAQDTNHRPCLANAAWPDFNVSHAGAYGLIAMSARRRVGVDVEQCGEQFDWRSVARLALHPDEAAWIDALDARQQGAAFYDAWVAKEALVKTTGMGITRGIQHLKVLPREGAHVNLRNATPDDLRDIRAQWLDVPEGYAACLAWSAERAL